MNLISLYVNDILVYGSNLDEVERIKKFTEHYEMKNLGELNYYLVMKITRSVALNTRPDFFNVVGVLARFNINPISERVRHLYDYYCI